jgi:hypothetical protein
VDARLLMIAVGYHQATVDIDTRDSSEASRLLPNTMRVTDDNTKNANSMHSSVAIAEGEEGDGDNVTVERRLSSRTNVNFMHMQTRRAIGPRELVAWGVAAVMTLASIMR